MHVQRIFARGALHFRSYSRGHSQLKWLSSMAVAHSSWFKIEDQGMVRYFKVYTK